MDVEQFKIPTGFQAKPKQHKRHVVVSSKKSKHFIPNIPLTVIAPIMNMDGKALHFMLALWYQSGIGKCATVTLPDRILKQFGLTRQAYYRICKQFEKFDLITVSKKSGACAKITLKARVK